MSEETKTEEKTGPQNAKPAGGERLYTVLELVQPAEPENNVPATWVDLGTFKAKDEKEARWAAVDANESLTERTKTQGQAPMLVAVSDRNWTPKTTTEIVVQKAQRS